MRLLRSALHPDGVILVNLLASTEGGASRFYKTLRSTFALEFPMVQTFAVDDPAAGHLWQNILLTAGRDMPAKSPGDPTLQKMLSHQLPVPTGTCPVAIQSLAVARLADEANPAVPVVCVWAAPPIWETRAVRKTPEASYACRVSTCSPE